MPPKKKASSERLWSTISITRHAFMYFGVPTVNLMPLHPLIPRGTPCFIHSNLFKCKNEDEAENVAEYINRIVSAFHKRVRAKVAPTWSTHLATVPVRDLDSVLSWWNGSVGPRQRFTYTMVQCVGFSAQDYSIWGFQVMLFAVNITLCVGKTK